RFARRGCRFDGDLELLAHLLRIEARVLLARAVDFGFPDVAHTGEGLEIVARHAARADHADRVAVFSREIFHAQSRAGRDAHVLEKAVVDERDRHAVARAEHEQEAAISSGLDAVLVLALVALLSRPADDVREHARDDVAVAARAAGHERPTIVALRPLARQVNVDAPHRRGVAL